MQNSSFFHERSRGCYRHAALLGLACLLIVSGTAAADADKPAKAGVAVKVITPEEPLWMAGYSARTKPAEGKVHELYIKALALEDPAGGKLVLLTSDLIGLPRSLSDKVAQEVQKRTGLPRERLLMNSSHTHCGPALRDNLTDMYPFSPEMAKKIDAYTEQLGGRMVDVIGAALNDLKPARLTHGRGTARFAVNRREPTPNGIINGRNPEGPVDHDVPVLKVEAADGTLRAVVFGYACHNTTLSFYQWCGDYAGFAQAYLEEKHPGAVALFWIGCGGDANPLPRGSLEHARKYGRELAEAVEAVLADKNGSPVQGAWAARYAQISLPLEKLPTKEQLAAGLLSKELAVKNRAARLLKALENDGKLDDHYPHYPVQVWRLGDLAWIALGGEVVIDYNLRLKKERAGAATLWVAGYCNDVMAYIPSARVLKEGGYEADSSMIYYGFPTRWSPAIEDKIVAKVHELVKETAPQK